MAEKKIDEKNQFEREVYKLGLELIEDYRKGRCRDSPKTLAAIIEIFKVSQRAELFLLEGKENGI